MNSLPNHKELNPGPFPVVGMLTFRTLNSKATAFGEFDCPEFQITGLAQCNEGILWLLAVLSKNPKKGNLRKFILKCIRHYPHICVICIMNKDLANILRGLGFKDAKKIRQDLRPAMYLDT